MLVAIPISDSKMTCCIEVAFWSMNIVTVRGGASCAPFSLIRVRTDSSGKTPLVQKQRLLLIVFYLDCFLSKPLATFKGKKIPPFGRVKASVVSVVVFDR